MPFHKSDHEYPQRNHPQAHITVKIRRKQHVQHKGSLRTDLVQEFLHPQDVIPIAPKRVQRRVGNEAIERSHPVFVAQPAILTKQGEDGDTWCERRVE